MNLQLPAAPERASSGEHSGNESGAWAPTGRPSNWSGGGWPEGAADEDVRMVVIQFVYALVCLVGLAGNAMVIFVILRYAKMKTATNIYLLNLALADELFMLSVPFVAAAAALDRWPFGPLMCRAVLSVDGLNQFTSVFGLTVLSADRYVAVVHPIKAARYRRPSVARLVNLGVWLLSLLVILPIVVFAGTAPVGGGSDSAVNPGVNLAPGSAGGSALKVGISSGVGFSVSPGVNMGANSSVIPAVSLGINSRVGSSVNPSVSVNGGSSVNPSVSVGVGSSVNPSVSVGVGSSVIPSVSVNGGSSVNPSVSVGVGSSVNPSVSVNGGSSVNPSVSVGKGSSVNPSVSVGVGSSVNPSVSVNGGSSVNPSVSVSVGSSVNPSVSVGKRSSVNPSVSVGVDPSVDSNGKVMCAFLWPQPAWSVAFVVYTFLLGFLLPVLAISLCYLLIILQTRAVALKAGWQQRRRSERKLTRLVLTVVAVFVVCWLPFYAVHLAGVFLAQRNTTVNHLCVILSYANSCANPILYGFLSDNFRRSFQRILCFRWLENDTEEPVDYCSTALKSKVGSPLEFQPAEDIASESVYRNGTCTSRTTTL
ncbi:somatostatin receptor type 1-like isoform X1 [Chiloscyllium plagiosum]|uniref:somatostatin receptor type 1-like isoform X1 n=1 Tax=Chiloscyllium plagiosum TaxID=36176 RepID=UPI001CB884DC|nr:somatostatin receptor type 1-like isoform X1 [Chiloscyllium plagiosum]XP_043552483.1 somatostatin receptor type 1-like isoform X1 [Chiloscyllium plagiosum]XP_043552484.1 somatostatin receptor type 1-like isoform X1 [Chiloscyllium plagiosum]